jgi:hypothetical protein
MDGWVSLRYEMYLLLWKNARRIFSNPILKGPAFQVDKDGVS